MPAYPVASSPKEHTAALAHFEGHGSFFSMYGPPVGEQTAQMQVLPACVGEEDPGAPERRASMCMRPGCDVLGLTLWGFREITLMQVRTATCARIHEPRYYAVHSKILCMYGVLNDASKYDYSSSQWINVPAPGPNPLSNACTDLGLVTEEGQMDRWIGRRG
ncbi:hypothetical protein CMQ_5817 [Grosmannia clavigera kw1407]|uniref:Uncharacterized protein n=1 Tax=Grosmannia clavigera (strain kw1407 / UAMH 11150) TaxID=655863 RepID=F0XIH0_GROCL|nr:uncharacterized protein CMQ_5817 [Grosmannia clavigera kw1407]EFX02456.1 hypothetical protein CMQ_5817 [Grosmannia clavigera kw1407]